MTVLNVLINGQALRRAGLDRPGVVTFELEADARPERPDDDDDDGPPFAARVNGAVFEESWPFLSFHLEWHEAEISVGDVFCVTVTDDGSPDAPRRIKQSHPLSATIGCLRAVLLELPESDDPSVAQLRADIEAVCQHWLPAVRKGIELTALPQK